MISQVSKISDRKISGNPPTNICMLTILRIWFFLEMVFFTSRVAIASAVVPIKQNTIPYRFEGTMALSFNIIKQPNTPNSIPTKPIKPIFSTFVTQEKMATSIGNILAIMTAKKASILPIAIKLHPR